jgi:hypothetical protein
MATDNQSTTGSKGMIWTGRVISGVVVLMLTFSAVMKLIHHEEVTKELTRLGWPDIAVGIGILEAVCTIIYAIPQTAVLGAILLTGYLGGATATHVRIDDPFFGPVIGGVLVWLGLFLREPRLRALVPLRR